MDLRDLCKPPSPRKRGHSLALLKALDSRPDPLDRACNLGADCERERRPGLILALALEQIEEVQPTGPIADQDLSLCRSGRL